jgi:hypothetical protein
MWHLGWFEDNEFVVEQLFLDKPGKEIPMLEHLLKHHCFKNARWWLERGFEWATHDALMGECLCLLGRLYKKKVCMPMP